MCGTYHFGENLKSKLKGKIPEKQWEQIEIGDLFPGMDGVVLMDSGYKVLKWGFSEEWSKRPLFNARSESVMEKKSFKDNYINNKCIIVASSFYEYDEKKNKYEYSLKGSDIIYMAGCYKINENGEDEYTIITQQAPAEYIGIHSRIPLILKENELEDYLNSGDDAAWLTPRHPKFNIVEKAK